MKKLQTLTVNGETYVISDPQAATKENIDDATKAVIDKLCPSFSESGSMIRCEPVKGYPLSVTAEEGATTISQCGKNLIDYTKAEGRNASSVVNIIENRVEWTAGNYYFIIPCNIKAGETVMFSCVDTEASIGNTALYNRDTKTMCSNQAILGKPITADADANAILVYKKNPATNIETPIVMTNLQLECGSVATEYEPYKGIKNFAPGETVPALSGVNTIWADNGEITVTGKADPVAIINNLSEQMAALSKTVATILEG